MTKQYVLPLIVCLGSLAVPAAAQMPMEEDIIVTGRYDRVPDNAQSASQPVSYADLDLGTAAGREELRTRVRLTARYLCSKLGESNTASPGPSCRDAAYKDAMSRVGTLEEGWAPRGTAWVARPAWRAPYPDDWRSRYPR